METVKRKPVKFEPEYGHSYSGAGQCIESIAAMTHTLPEDKKPIIVALYESIDQLGYRMNPDIMEAHNIFPGAFLQIGLQLPVNNRAELEKVGDGGFDDQIRLIANNYKCIKLPIFLRIGYEFDGEWNAYEPKAYKKAYRRIVDVFTQCGVENVSYVWNTHIADNTQIFDWYPDNPESGEKDGDKYVDWFSFNTMSQNFGAGWFMEQANVHGKPVILGESSYAIVKAGYTFEECADDLFRAIRHYGIKGWQYINWEWQSYPENASWNTWENGRYTDDDCKVSIYNSHLDAAGLLFRDSSYHQPVVAFINCARKMREADGEGMSWEKLKDQWTLTSGYNYYVTDAVVRYGDGWHPYWESTGSSLTIQFTLPVDFCGYFIFAANPGQVFEDNDQAVYTVDITGNRYRTSFGRGGYCKIPLGSHSTRDGFLSVTFEAEGDQTPDEKNNKIRLSQVGLLIMHKNPLKSPKMLSLKKSDNGVELSWDAVEGAFLYNIYRDNQLIAMTDKLYYLDTSYCGRSCIYVISAYSELRGEGTMSNPLTI